MILSAQSIRAICLNKNMISPFSEGTKINGYSGGLSACGYDIHIAEDIVLLPGDFSLASTVEAFHIPNNIIGVVHDKSTWARQGLALQNTVIEPGWIGQSLTLELSNHGGQVLDIVSGTPIAQIVFQWLDEPTELPYKGKYQQQELGPQQARF